MKPLLLFLAVLAAPVLGHSQTLTGKFYVSVDDAAILFVNGEEVYRAPLNESYSPTLSLSRGDRVVVQLKNRKGYQRFLMVFIASDENKLINFRLNDGKVIPGTDATDFTPQEFSRWPVRPVRLKIALKLPVKSYSQWMWGDAEDSCLAFIVTPAMFSNRPL